MEDILGLIIGGIFITVAVLFPLFVIVQSIVNFVRASDGRWIIALKGLVALGVWAALSFTCFLLMFMGVFEADRGGVDRATADRRMTILALVLTVIYTTVNLVMAYLIRPQAGWKTLPKAQSEI